MYGHFHRWFINAFARHYVRIWERENEEYLEYLDKMQLGKKVSVPKIA